MTCDRCGATMQVGEWPFCPHGFASVSVINDELEGGARWFDTLGHEPVYIASKSQWKREVAARNLEHVDRHDRAYYDRKFRQHQEHIKDTGRSPDGVRV